MTPQKCTGATVQILSIEGAENIFDAFIINTEIFGDLAMSTLKKIPILGGQVQYPCLCR